jgi:cytochrome c biogenesis protein CcdA
LGLILAAREWGWIRFPLPQRRRQTEKVWAHQFGFVIASGLWGFDIGLGFATRISTGGFWMLTIVAIALGDPAYGGLLMLMYWLGRALTVWTAPALITRGSDPYDLLNAIETETFVTHRIAGVGLMWSAAVAIAFAVQMK